MKKNESKNQNQKIYQIKANMAESLNLPKDTILGSAIVTITGYEEVYVENYKGILEFCEQCIVLSLRGCQLRIEGTRLQIAYYTATEMRILGKIRCLQYER